MGIKNCKIDNTGKMNFEMDDHFKYHVYENMRMLGVNNVDFSDNNSTSNNESINDEPKKLTIEEINDDNTKKKLESVNKKKRKKKRKK